MYACQNYLHVSVLYSHVFDLLIGTVYMDLGTIFRQFINISLNYLLAMY